LCAGLLYSVKPKKNFKTLKTLQNHTSNFSKAHEMRDSLAVPVRRLSWSIPNSKINCQQLLSDSTEQMAGVRQEKAVTKFFDPMQ